MFLGFWTTPRLEFVDEFVIENNNQKNKIQNQIITEHSQLIKKYKSYNSRQCLSSSKKIVFILPVIPFQNSWCLRLVGEYPVIPFQIQSGYVLKDENGNVVFPVNTFQNSCRLQRQGWRHRYLGTCQCLSDSWCLQLAGCSTSCHRLSNSRCLQGLLDLLAVHQSCRYPSNFRCLQRGGTYLTTSVPCHYLSDSRCLQLPTKSCIAANKPVATLQIPCVYNRLSLILDYI